MCIRDRRGADPASFRVLNYAYAMDKTAVYTTSGRIPDVELAAFQVLDNGQNDSGAPQGLSLIHIFADEACAMPGSFAVFALGLEGEQWAPLVAEYLDLCDDEHSSLQEKFLHALIRKFGFQPWTLGVLVRGALSMQNLKPAKEFRSLIANAESLDALLTVKRRFSAYLLPEEDKDPKFRAIAWQSLLWAIWGPSSENGGSKVIKTVPKELKEKYQQVFA